MAGRVSCNSTHLFFIVAGKSHNTLEETSYFEDSSENAALFVAALEKLNDSQTVKKVQTSFFTFRESLNKRNLYDSYYELSCSLETPLFIAAL